MHDITLSVILGAWGAILSTLLAGVKIWEIWRDRHRIEIGHNFTSDESIGHSISIRNLSGRAFILSYWELVYGAGCWPFRTFDGLRSPDHDVSDIKIEAYSTYTLSFCDEDHFGWGPKALKGRKIYIRMHVAGRKPMLCLVYPTDR
ncbi:hypothetical protein AWB81_07430 [Caballeronia arationis]|nr:hypothetical protein AWB81_07430 [Caballeronia arationis]